MASDPPVTTARLPATGGQTSLFFAEQRSVSQCSYNLPTVLEIEGPVGVDDLVAAGRRLGAATAGLRVRLGIDEDSGRVVQWVSDEPPRVDVADLDAGADLGDVAEDLAREPFDPDEGPLARLAVLRLGPDRAALVAVTHHLVIDGISLPSLARRMAEAVCGGLVGQPADRYLDVVRHVLAAEDVARHRDRERWAERLPEGVRLPHWDTAATGGPPPDVADGRRLVTLSPAETTRLAAAVAAHGTNVFRYLLAAIHRALPVTGGDLTPVCAAASVRPRDGGQDDVVGCFVNEVPMTAEAVGPAASISDLLRRFDDRWRADLRRRAHPLVDVVGRVARDRSGGALQLNSVTASYRRTPDRLRWTDGPLRLSADLYQRYPAAKNEVCVRAFHHADHLRYEVQWGRNLPGGLGEVFTERLAAALSDPPGSPSAAR